MDDPPVTMVKPGCALCHARVGDGSCGCEEKMRHPYWMFSGFRPVYRPSQRAIFHRLMPPRPFLVRLH